jgi:hypothetical protein
VWIAVGVPVLFIAVGVVMHRVFSNILKQGSEEPSKKAANHE